MEFLTAATLLFFILDPFGNLPLFQSIIGSYPSRRQRQIVLREALIALVILLTFLFTGNALLAFLGLDPSTLSISGGVILFLIALGMIFPQRSVNLESKEDDEPLIVPLAMPLMAGPSSLAYLLLLASKYPERQPEWAAALLLAWLSSTLILLFSPAIFKSIGQKGSRALERLMGMLLIMIATQMFLDGLRSYLEA